MIQLSAHASNGAFSGATRVYADRESLRTFVEALKGFPKHCNDELTLEAGESGGYSYLSLRFYCYNSVGHSALQVRIVSNDQDHSRAEGKSIAEFEIRTEPSLIDLFHQQLIKVVDKEEGEASLQGLVVF